MHVREIDRVVTADVDFEENTKFESFHETTARNAGLSFKWFVELYITDMNAGRVWLKSRKRQSFPGVNDCLVVGASRQKKVSYDNLIVLGFTKRWPIPIRTKHPKRR